MGLYMGGLFTGFYGMRRLMRAYYVVFIIIIT